MSDELNQFDYFTEIEETFTRLREKHLLLSPLDWTLIESWKERGIPLTIVLRSIEEVFKNQKSGARRRAINSLRYCQGEVETQYAAWLQSQVGKNDAGDAVSTGSVSDRVNPFVKDAIIAHLAAKSGELFTLTEVPDGLKIATLHVTDKLSALITGISVATDRIDVANLEFGLTTLEAILDCAIEAVATADQIAKARAAAEALFALYREKMPPNVYEQQIDSQLKKHLRELFGVPRLSLFHMK